jgi:uridine phosphorylase
VLLLPFGRRSFLPAIAAAYQGREMPLDETTDRIAVALGGAGEGVTLLYSGMGGPAAANAVEMAAANGARRLVVFGACGGVSPELAVGDLVVVTGAVRGDGASRSYAPVEYPAAFDPMLVTALWRRCDQGPIAAHRGVVYTTDAGYRQGPDIYDLPRGLIVAVESECSTVAVVAARLGLEAAALLFCTDNVTVDQHADRSYTGLADPRVRRGFEHGLAAAVDALATGPRP